MKGPRCKFKRQSFRELLHCELTTPSQVIAIGWKSCRALTSLHSPRVRQQIQSCIVDDPAIPCTTCRETTLDINVIRSRLFPELAALRKYANALIHHLDHPKNRGIAELNVQGVFDYCYHLFQENAELLFGRVPESSFPYTKCKESGAKDAGCQ